MATYKSVSSQDLYVPYPRLTLPFGRLIDTSTYSNCILPATSRTAQVSQRRDLISSARVRDGESTLVPPHS